MRENGSELLAVDVELPAALEQLATVPDHLRPAFEALSVAEQERYNIVLALHEVLVNIIEHAYQSQDGRIDLKVYVNLDARQLRIESRDWGAAFNPGTVPAPELGGLQEHGFGLFLVRELMDSVDYKADDNGNRWTLIKRLGA